MPIGYASMPLFLQCLLHSQVVQGATHLPGRLTILLLSIWGCWPEIVSIIKQIRSRRARVVDIEVFLRLVLPDVGSDQFFWSTVCFHHSCFRHSVGFHAHLPYRCIWKYGTHLSCRRPTNGKSMGSSRYVYVPCIVPMKDVVSACTIPLQLVFTTVSFPVHPPYGWLKVWTLHYPERP
jgi:hypothetical protein